MKRRELIQSLGLISGHALFPSILANFLASCAQEEKFDYEPAFFSQAEYKAVIEMIDLIIPATKTKSASQVNTQVFLDQVFAQCLTTEQQDIIRKGLEELMPDLSGAGDKSQLLLDLDKKAYDNVEDASWFKTLKRYTLIGFFTSQEGTTKASNYVKVPEAYKGEIPADENTLNYGRTSLQYSL